MCSLGLLEQLTQVSGYCLTAVQHKVSAILLRLFWLFRQVHSTIICTRQVSMHQVLSVARPCRALHDLIYPGSHGH